MMALLWSVVCLAGLWGSVACTIGLILNGFPARDVFDSRRSLKWGCALVICFISWIIGMANA
jgi:hypothetical protein